MRIYALNLLLNTEYLKIDATYIQTTREPYPLHLPYLDVWVALDTVGRTIENTMLARNRAFLMWVVGSHRLPHLISYLNRPFDTRTGDNPMYAIRNYTNLWCVNGLHGIHTKNTTYMTFKWHTKDEYKTRWHIGDFSLIPVDLTNCFRCKI